MIEGDTIDCQAAIFRILKNIPDLCNLSSREDIGQVEGEQKMQLQPPQQTTKDWQVKQLIVKGN